MDRQALPPPLAGLTLPISCSVQTPGRPTQRSSHGNYVGVRAVELSRAYFIKGIRSPCFTDGDTPGPGRTGLAPGSLRSRCPLGAGTEPSLLSSMPLNNPGLLWVNRKKSRKGRRWDSHFPPAARHPALLRGQRAGWPRASLILYRGATGPVSSGPEGAMHPVQVAPLPSELCLQP